MSIGRIILLALFLLVASAPGRAEENTVAGIAINDEAQPDTEPLWEWYLAAFSRYGAIYPGSAESQFNFIPLPFPRYRGKFLRVGEDTQNPLRGRIFRTDRIKLDLDIDINFGADAEDIDVRAGMSDLDFLLEVGPELSLQFVDHLPSKWSAFLNLPLRATFSWPGFDPRYRGVVFAPELRFRKRFNAERRDELTLRLTPSFASSEYMDYYYGVGVGDANASRPAFSAKAGYLGTELAFTARKQLADRLEIVGGVQLAYLGGAQNRDSPLFEDNTNASVFVAFLWKLWESRRRVPALD